MDPLDKELLEKVARLSQENHKMLKQVRSYMRWSRFMSIIYWIFIIGIAVGAYYYIQPYLELILGTYMGFSDQIGNFGDFFGR